MKILISEKFLREAGDKFFPHLLPRHRAELVRDLITQPLLAKVQRKQPSR
jgi:hypothetical protein